MKRRLAVFGAAIALDLGFGELPTPVHPVAWLGRGASAFGRCLPRGTVRRDLASGLVLATAVPLVAAGACLAATRAARRLHPLAGFAAEVFLVKQTFAVRALFEHTAAVREPLVSGDLEGARTAVSRVVSRDTTTLDTSAVASAAIESLAENASDSAVAPWAWYAAGGLPAATAYRAINTLDATFGYRHEGRFGMPSARLDDAANLVPARLTAACLALLSARPFAAIRGTLADARNTPSPNSGWPMAAAAHALGVRLEKQDHHVLNASGVPPEGRDIAAALNLTGRALALAAAVVAGALLRWRRT
jgi:adenosylcobinamide-phosphate synthase